jgi:hypothetical protein
MMKKLFLATLLAAGFGFESELSFAQTPHLNCDAAANNASAYVKSNEADDCIDAAINDVDAITAFLTATRTLDMPDDIERRLVIKNSTTGSQDITISQNSGRTITIPNGGWADVQLDGTNVDEAAIAISGTELVSADAGDRVPIFDDSAGLVKWIDGTSVGGGSAGISAGPGSKSPLFHVREENTSGTICTDVSTTSAYNTLILDTSVTAEIEGGSLASNQITLPAGDYFMIARAAAYRADDVALRLRDITNSVTLAIGQPVNAANNGTTDDSIQMTMYGKFSLSGTAAIELQLWLEANGSGNSTGRAVSSGETEVCNDVLIWQIENITTQTTDGNYAQALTIDLASGEVATITAMIQGLLSTGADAYSARIFQTCLNIAGTTTAGTEDLVESEVGGPNASLDVQVNCNDTDDRLDLEIRGATSETWDWEITYDVIKQ